MPLGAFARRAWADRKGSSLVLSQTLDENEQDCHLLLSTQPRQRTALRELETQFRWGLVAPCEGRA